MSKAGREILVALRELKEALDSGEPLEQRFTVRHYEVHAKPRPSKGRRFGR